ncbi:MAG: SurA N-terminal domain-containing protein, partial [Helicobacteraceae bacterium]|nr:SurA N-terminal domain-containing protein [Helicobacteraceae bacterium]
MRLLLIFAFLSAFASAAPINAIAAVVEGEPITLYDIETFAASEKITKAIALDRLIDVRLREAKIKELGLSVGADEVDSRVDLIAKRNNLDAATLKEVLIRRGADFDKYQEEIKETLLNEKIAAYVLAGTQIPVSEEEIERFYAANPSLFTQPSEIVVIQYAAKDER